MLKKRYIYASLLAGLVFLILYLILNFNILISLILTILTYIGGILFYKEKDVRKYDPNLIMHYCYLISKLYNYTNSIEDEIVNKNIKEITDEAEKIIIMLEQKPNKVTQVYDGFDYYLPLSIKVMEHYVYLKKKSNLTNKEKGFMLQINVFLDNIEKEISKLLENMNYTRMLDINSRIEIFKKGNEIVNSKEVLEEVHEIEGR
ncbi:MAG: 5-bromo-4-chloroindolyl phosphate hydrolysis family protein [Firmicutes bacterium]|nr:5-bromo-4-chloroindolyl phosphate hydrolysis family protein [Bacillota bacterium]